MSGRIARTAWCAASLILCAGVGRAQKPIEPEQVFRIAGDGAAECSAAKIAASMRASHRERSVASSHLDATYYHLDLFVGMDDDSIAGTVRVEGRVTGVALSKLTLDLASSMEVTSVRLADGTPLAFTHTGKALTITLPSAQAPGTLVAVDIAYGGIPVEDDFGNFVFGTRNVNGTDYKYAWSLSEPYGAREWWPCKDHPSDKADSVRVTVTVPSEYRVGSQGLLVSETTTGPNTTYDWLSHYPIASYLVSVAIGNYAVHTGTYNRPPALAGEFGPLSMPLYHLRYDDSTPTLPEGWAKTDTVMAVAETWFGPYPFASEKYGHAEFTFGGGMEHQTLASMGTSAVSIVMHELAHQWYGDSITPKSWKDLWLNEGFATHAELLYYQERADAYPGYYDAVRISRIRSAKEAEGTLVLQDTTSASNMFDPYRVYAKGAVVMYMLQYVVGDDVFKSILRTYAADPAVKYGNAVTADFQRVAEQVSGLDLDTFFRQWVTEGTGYPTYGKAVSSEPIAGGYRVTVTVSQDQVPFPSTSRAASKSNVNAFDMPMEIAIVAQSPDTVMEVHRETVRNHLRTETYSFDVAVPDGSFRISHVNLDPDLRILRSEYVNNIGGTPSAPQILSLGPNPTTGTLRVQVMVDEAGRTDIQVFDVAGRRVLTQPVSLVEGFQYANIDASTLPSGVYFVRLSTAHGATNTRFVVVR
jgi:aminopeptidase N